MSQQRSTQDSFAGTAVRGPNELQDLIGLFPEKVMPTRFYVLQQGDDLLFLKPIKYKTHGLPAPLRRIVQLLVSHGNSPDSPGNIAVCLWRPVQVLTRHILWFDHMGRKEMEIHLDDFRQSILDWWKLRRPR